MAHDTKAATNIIELCEEIQELAEKHEKQTRKALNPGQAVKPKKKPSRRYADERICSD